MRRLVLLFPAVVTVVVACSSQPNTGFGGAGSSTTSTGTPTTTSTGTSTTTSTGTSTTTSTGISTTTSTTSSTSSSSTSSSGDASIPNPCDLPGSIQFTDQGTVGTGTPGDPDLTFLHLPVGFCAHYYGTVGNVRQLRFAPGGELFAASPTTPTTGGGQDGKSAIVVLPDDNLDGRADANLTFLGSLPSTQGLMFIPGFFYYQDGSKIMRVPYAPGDRTPSGASTSVVNITYYSDSLHWPKTMDMADDGTIYIGNGGSQGDQCITPHPFKGGIRSVDSSTTNATDGTPVAQGFRNPIAVRCLPGHNTCFSLELALDYSAGQGGREKMVPIRTGDDWGFPCCATKNVPYASSPTGTSCAAVTAEDVSWFIGDTPFGLAFAPSTWPGMWSGSAIATTHGAAGSWVGARVVAIAMDQSTGMPVPGTNMNGQDMGSMTDFATGWDDGTLTHGRPSAVEVSPDGRLFIANDSTGVIFWVAPMGS